MLNRLQAASRLLIRASLALFTGIVLLLIQSAFWSNRVSAWMQLVIFAMALLSYFRPHYGLLALAVLAPLGQVGSRTLDSSMRGAEALVLAFLAGALVRGWTLREFRTFPSTRLHVAALIFGFVVAASCVEQIWFAQIQRDFAWPFVQELFTYASRNYIVTTRNFGMVLRAMLLLEGLALLLYTARYTAHRPEFGTRLVAAIIAGASATAVLTIAVQFLEAREAATTFLDFVSKRRGVHVGDVNASGSYFALTAFIASGVALHASRRRVMWLAAGLLLFVVMLMTGSRTAVAAAGLVGVLFLLRVALTHSRYAIRAAGAAAAVVLVLGAAYLILRTTGATPSQALSIRWVFLRTTSAMLAAEPSFGVGIGQFAASAERFGPPDLFTLWRPDNAHNNFAQIAGELGVTGLITFTAVLALSLWHRNRGREFAVFLAPVLLGLYAFVLTWLGGHPLLVPEVSYPFWLALGIAAALVAADAVAPLATGIAGTAALLLALSIPFRVNGLSGQLDFSRVSYGVSAKQMMTTRARFFVPAGTARVEFPLRSRTADDDEPVAIDVVVDGTASDTITLSDREWRRSAISLPADSSRRFHQIDLQIRTGAADEANPDRQSVEVGKWEIIAKPNG
jgi:hypothetical protein